MVPEKAEHLEHEGMAALSLLVRGFKLLAYLCIDLYVHLGICMLVNIHSFLTASHPNTDHLQSGLRSGPMSQPHLLKACPVCIFLCRHRSKMSQENVSPVDNNPSHLT